MTYEATTYAILILCAYRVTRFFVRDSLLGFAPESNSEVSVRVDTFAYNEDGTGRSFIREKIGDLLTCTYCLGFWVSLGIYASYASATDTWSGVALVLHGINVFAIAGGQAYLNSRINA